MKRLIIILFSLTCTVVAFAQQNTKKPHNRYGVALKEVDGVWKAGSSKFNNRTDTIPHFLEPYINPPVYANLNTANVTSKEYVYKAIPNANDKKIRAKAGGYFIFDSPKGQGDGPFPCLVFIHGGAWTNGSPDDQKIVHLGAFLASQGIAVARVAYSKSPDFTIENTLSDLDNAIAFIRQHAKELKVDPNRMGLSGSSAGGHLSSYMGMTRPGFKVIISMCGPQNLVKLFQAEQMSEGRGNLLAYFKAEGNNTVSLEKYSPLFNIPEKDKIPSMLMIHGEWDTSVSFLQSVEMKAALELKGGEVQFYPVKYASHSIFDESLADFRNIVLLIAAYAKEHL